MQSLLPFVGALSASLGSPLTLGAEGTVELQFEEGFAVTLEAVSEDRFYLYSVLGPAPQDGPALRRFLEAQCFGMGTGDAAFAIDPIRDELLLMRSIEIARWQPHEMPGILAEFIRGVTRWNESGSAPIDGVGDTTGKASGPIRATESVQGDTSVLSAGLIQTLRV